MILDFLFFFNIIKIILGLFLLIKLSPIVVKYSVKLGEIFHVSPMLIGIIAVAIGTSLPEIATGVVSSVSGHAEINIGNCIGSALSNLTIIMGLSVLISGTLKTERKNIFVLGSAVILSTIISYFIVTSGTISRLSGFFLVITYVAIFYLINSGVTKKEYVTKEYQTPIFSDFVWRYMFFLLLGLLGIVLGSMVLIDGVGWVSVELGIPEFIISFLVVSIGTSLPELFVGISALRKKEYELFLGDILGSNVTDLTLAIGVGPIFSPNFFDSALVEPTTGYLTIVTVIIILIMGIRKKIDRKTAILLLVLYFMSYLLLF